MPAQSVDNLFRSLNKGDLALVYYFHGQEDVLKDEAVRTILDQALDPSLRDFNFDQRSAAQLDAEEVNALCNTLPMLAERRVVVLREVEAWKRKTKGRAEFLRYLERPSPDTIVILVQGSAEEGEDRELAAGATTVRFDPLPPERARKWLLNQAGRLGVALETDAAEHLVRSVGSDLGALQSELSKLASLPAGEPLTASRVGELVGVRHGETLWDWREALLDGQTGRAATLLPLVLAQAGVSGVKLVTAVGTALVGLGIARAHYDRGLRGRSLEAAVMKSLLSVRPFGMNYKDEADRWSDWAPQWPGGRIRAALRIARDTDMALKNTTVSDERGLLLDLVLRIGVKDGEDGKDGKDGKGKDTRSKWQAGALVAAASPSSPSRPSPLPPRTNRLPPGRGDSRGAGGPGRLGANPGAPSARGDVADRYAVPPDHLHSGDGGERRQRDAAPAPAGRRRILLVELGGRRAVAPGAARLRQRQPGRSGSKPGADPVRLCRHQPAAAGVLLGGAHLLRPEGAGTGVPLDCGGAEPVSRQRGAGEPAGLSRSALRRGTGQRCVTEPQPAPAGARW